jgi:hypothetical protein
MSAHLQPSPPVLPDGSVLVHIGMHKTGTTAMQTLLAHQRPSLLAQGVLYPGKREDHHTVARSLTQQATGSGGVDKPPSPQLWADLVAELADERRRTVLSSEYFSVARGDEPVRLVGDLGRGRTHIVVGIRNATDSATSAWQQTLKQNRISDIDRWAATVLPYEGRPPKDPNFWAWWDLGAMVRRWSAAAGPENMTVVVVDAVDRDRLPATFERLLGLRAGTLVGKEPPIRNRSLTAPEAELFRRLNVELRGELDWPTYKRVVRFGVIRRLVESRTPEPDEPRPALPAWAVEVTRESGERAAAEIRETGVRVVGDLAALSAQRPPAAPIDLDRVPTELAVQALAAAIRVENESTAREISEIPGREMVQVLGRRLRKRARRSVERARERLAGQDEPEPPRTSLAPVEATGDEL